MSDNTTVINCQMCDVKVSGSFYKNRLKKYTIECFALEDSNQSEGYISETLKFWLKEIIGSGFKIKISGSKELDEKDTETFCRFNRENKSFEEHQAYQDVK